MAIFPEGQLCVEIDGRLAASSSSLILEYDASMEWHNWKVVADGGYIRNHKPKGDTLYGIEIMVDPEFRGMKLSRRLYDARKELCRQKNLSRIIIGGRIPGYHQHSETLTAREYIERVVDKSLYDPVLTAQLSNGFSVAGLDPQLLAVRYTVMWVRDTPGMEEPRSCRRCQTTFPSYRRTDSNLRRPVPNAVRIRASKSLRNSVSSFSIRRRTTNAILSLFPELFTTQLLSCVKTNQPGQAARRLAEFTPQYLDLFAELAVKYDVNVIGGSQFVVEHDTLYNVSYLFQRDGAIGKQYKIHITPSERKWWGVSPGNRVEVFDTDCGRVAIQICYDIEFPELTRIASEKGAQIVFVPFNTDTRHGYLRVRHCARHAASRTICMSRFPAAPAIYRLSKTPISTTPSQESLRRPTQNSLETPWQPSVTPMSKP